MSNVLSYNRGSHNVRSGFDLRKMATGRRAANDPRGRFDFTGNLTAVPGVSVLATVADFMLGLPRTVIPPTDQIQGHVGGWRNGFFVNDVWQASRNLTLSLGLRYELNTPVQTYEGVASMLDSDFETIIPSPNLSAYPVPGFKFHEPNYKDIAPRLGATYRLGEKTVVRAGYGIYYNPNQMNSFTFLTNNPPVAAVTTYTSDPANPNLVVFKPDAVRICSDRLPGRTSSRRRAICRTRARTSGAWICSGSCWRGTALDIQYVGSNTQPPGSQLLQQPADAGTGQRRRIGGPARDSASAGSSPTISSPITMRSASSSASATATDCRPTPTTRGRAPATWRRIRTAAARRWTTTTSIWTTALRTGTSRTASWRATCTTFRS